jgi:hypothetical protein
MYVLVAWNVPNYDQLLKMEIYGGEETTGYLAQVSSVLVHPFSILLGFY